MDIAKLTTREAHDAGAEVRIRDQFGAETDVYVRVVGMDSAVWRRIMRDQERRVLAAAASGTDEVEQDVAQTLAEATLGWRGLEANGEPLEFSAEAAYELYSGAPYIADQVDRFIGKRANFTNG
jgi:hypothetical protein